MKVKLVVGGDVSSLLKNIGPFSEEMARFYIGEAIVAIDFLHKNGITHRDIKPDNMLIDFEGHLKLTDFGLSKVNIKEEPEKQPELLGTPDYLAPELILGTNHNSSVDWWALGVCFYEFLEGVPAFNDETPELIFKNITNKELVIDDSISSDAKDLITKLLDRDPNTRLRCPCKI